MYIPKLKCFKPEIKLNSIGRVSSNSLEPNLACFRVVIFPNSDGILPVNWLLAGGKKVELKEIGI